jgi:hypothetical protein
MKRNSRDDDFFDNDLLDDFLDDDSCERRVEQRGGNEECLAFFDMGW